MTHQRITKFLSNKRSKKVIGQKVFMTAVITRGKRILSIGYNDYNRKSYGFKLLNNYKLAQGLHAELAAILKWKNKTSGATITVLGITRGGNLLRNTKPCNSCMNAILAVGIKEIVYMKNGIWAKTRIR